jgi:hypothetical protein
MRLMCRDDRADIVQSEEAWLKFAAIVLFFLFGSIVLHAPTR